MNLVHIAFWAHLRQASSSWPSTSVSSRASECGHFGLVEERMAVFEKRGIIGSKFLVKALQVRHGSRKGCCAHMGDFYSGS